MADPPRAARLAAALLLAAALVLPLWSTRMEAPQYRGEEALEVRVFAGRVRGDIDEIELLNQYVGVHLPLDTPELTLAPWVLALLLALAAAAALLPAGRGRAAAMALCLAMAAVLLGGAGLLQFRLYEMGHDRGPTIMEGVPDFTPPILGSKKIANFTAHMRLGAGGWAYLGALGLVAWSARRRAAREPAAGGGAEGRSAPPPVEPSGPARRLAAAQGGSR